MGQGNSGELGAHLFEIIFCSVQSIDERMNEENMNFGEFLA